MKMNRRTFVIHSILGTAALAAGSLADAENTQLKESDPQAVEHGYKLDATKTDKAVYPTYAKGQTCGTCLIYEDQSNGWGGCALFPGKQVSINGWCNAWAE